jgi:plastocyanin
MSPELRCTPQGKRVAVASLLWLIVSIGRATGLEVTISAPGGQPVEGVVVVLNSLDRQRAPVPPVQAVMDQQHRAFVPAVLVVPVGSKVIFPNSDSVSHQVYSFSPAKRFQLALYKGKPYPPVQFDHAGMIALGCNIHDQMRGFIYVVDGQYFGRTTGDGLWSADVTPGDYLIRLWHPLAKNGLQLKEQRITVAAGEAQTLRIQTTELVKSSQSAKHAGWDAY